MHACVQGQIVAKQQAEIRRQQADKRRQEQKSEASRPNVRFVFPSLLKTMLPSLACLYSTCDIMLEWHARHSRETRRP